MWLFLSLEVYYLKGLRDKIKPKQYIFPPSTNGKEFWDLIRLS
jgi:hypothetical protein